VSDVPGKAEMMSVVVHLDPDVDHRYSPLARSGYLTARLHCGSLVVWVSKRARDGARRRKRDRDHWEMYRDAPVLGYGVPVTRDVTRVTCVQCLMIADEWTSIFRACEERT
jgi:hypothetical protein